MHLGLLIYGDLATISGGYLYDRKLVETLRLCGDQVELFSIPWRSYPFHLLDNLSSRIYRQLADFQGDILLQDELNHPSLFWMNRRLSALHNCPLISIVHHLRCREPRPAWQNAFYRLIERSYLEAVDGFIVNSLTTQESLRELGLDLAKQPVWVALPAGDHERLFPEVDPNPEQIRARALEPGPMRLIFIGNLLPRKGLHHLLSAISQLPPGTVQLTVIGSAHADPAYSRSILRQIARLRLGTCVRMLGSLPEEKVAQELERHQVLAVPSTFEGYGIVYLEGMRFGLPAIGTKGGAAHEIITHDQNGVLIAPGDIPDLARRLAVLAQDRERLAEMGWAARRRFLDQPTWNETMTGVRSFLESFLAGRFSHSPASSQTSPIEEPRTNR